LVLGSGIVLGLFLLVLFGPLLAPSNPYIAGQHIVPHFDQEKRVWLSPPLDPSPEYPLGTDQWGHDILSMLLYGARNTLVACAFITMVRLLLGLILGAVAGWNEGGLTDGAIMGMIGIITSVPMLISGMLLVYALDIRRGLPVFIVALSVIGWTEIAQYIRSEFLVLRKKPYIDGARAVGSSGLEVAIRHILPNILPQLLVISFLELGAVLMLLGELSFIGVYIGGGSRIFLGDEISGQVLKIAEVPEWGAMLAEGNRWLRAKPFIVFPPAIAFFVSVVGLNAFGEGLRRLIEQYHINTNFLLRKRMVLVITGLSAATVFIINNTGPAPWFARVARAFDGKSAYAYAQSLSDMPDRAAGRAGGDQASAFIAEKFAEYGLKPGWKHSGFLYPFETQLVQPLEQPVLDLIGPTGEVVQSFRHQIDFGFVIEAHGGSGDVMYPLTFVGFQGKSRELGWEAYRGMDLQDQIVVLLKGNAPPEFPAEAMIRGARGVLWVVGDGHNDIRSQVQLADPDQFYLSQPTIPTFRIRPNVADAILETAGTNMEELIARTTIMEESSPGWFVRPLDATVRMSLHLSEPVQTQAPAVLGFLPGSDFDLSTEVVVLYANYDGLGQDPDGTVFPGANHNASGTSLLIEIARLWQEQKLNPRRSVLFIAWGGGELDEVGARSFLANATSLRHLPNQNPGKSLKPAVIFELNNVGAGEETLVAHTGSNKHLLEIVEEAANQVGVAVGTTAVEDVSEAVHIPNAAWISLAWSGGLVPPDQDTPDRIQEDKLQEMGETLSLALTKIVRESTY
jgi:peptide/nickel transport system permease protein